VNFLLDEFSSLPQISDFPEMMKASRSRNIRFNLIIQNISQLIKRYGHEAETIRNNCGNLVILHSREIPLLNEIIGLSGVKYNEDNLISAIKLQTMNKEKGEAFFLIKRLFPYFGNLPDIDQYPEISSNRKKAKYPANQNNVHSVFDFEEFCYMKSHESLSKLFSNRKNIEDVNKGKITETFFTTLGEDEMEERDKKRKKNMLVFLTELSALTKKYRFVIHGCENCQSLFLYDGKYMSLYPDLKYNSETDCYEVSGFNEEPVNNEGQTYE
jgi:hypothetical protein